MKQLFFYILALTLVFMFPPNGQARQSEEIKKTERKPAFYLGIGGGLDYGGFGFKASFEPVPYLSVFGGGGYNTASVAGNVGLTAHLMPDKKITPTILAMYGYNSVITFRERGLFSPITGYLTSTGVSVGTGVDFKWSRHSQKLSLAVLYPFRDSHFMYVYGTRMGYDKPFLMPVLFSIGWNFNILN